MNISEESYIRLTEEDVGKLDVIQSSIEESTSHRQIVKGGIDNLYCNALRYLYRDGEITDEGLENGLSHVDDYMAKKIKKVIEKDMARINN
tara:strand:- start:1115 stop:1387 length:273 start_codon:yes stop_codon:yes gene_type:complete